MNREALIAAMQRTAELKLTPVDDVPEWGLVYVRPATVEEVDATTDVKEAEGRNLRLARSAAVVLCDETGQRIFDPNNLADLELIARQPWELLQKVLEKTRTAPSKVNPEKNG